MVRDEIRRNLGFLRVLLWALLASCFVGRLSFVRISFWRDFPCSIVLLVGFGCLGEGFAFLIVVFFVFVVGF